MEKSAPRIVLSVGGSLIVPDGLDHSFLADFRTRVLRAVEQGFTFSIIAGGGKTARRYQEAAHEVRGDLHREDLDWIGIHATRLNAHLMRTLFREQAEEKIIKNPTRRIPAKKPIIIGAGWKPGWSTDYCAVLMAEKLGATKLVNLSDIDYVYTANPKTDPSAKPIEKISWADFRNIIPKEWDPGLSSPFDPIAAKEAEAMGLEVVVMNGKKLDEFSNYLAGKPFKGTVISS